MPRHNGTRGCTLLVPPQQGEQVLRQASGLSTAYRISAPAGYKQAVPQPLLLALHGWGMEHASEAGWHRHGQERGYIVVTPTGYSEGGGFAASWNGAGSVASWTAGPDVRPGVVARQLLPVVRRLSRRLLVDHMPRPVGQVASLLDEVMVGGAETAGLRDRAVQRRLAALRARARPAYVGAHRRLPSDARPASRRPTRRPPTGPALLGLWGLRGPFVPPRPNP